MQMAALSPSIGGRGPQRARGRSAGRLPRATRLAPDIDPAAIHGTGLAGDYEAELAELRDANPSPVSEALGFAFHERASSRRSADGVSYRIATAVLKVRELEGEAKVNDSR